MSKLKNYYLKRCQETGIPADQYDIEAHADETLTYEENVNILEKDYFSKLEDPLDLDIRDYKSQQEKTAVQKETKSQNKTTTQILDNHRTIAVFGDRDTAKTSLVLHWLKEYKGSKKIVLYAYPETQDTTQYDRIYSIPELMLVKNSIIFMDEMQKYVKFYDSKANSDILEILAIMAHKGNTLIFTTPLTQFITKAFDGFLDAIAYKQLLDLGCLKNGSKAKRLLKINKDLCRDKCNQWSLNLKKDEYIFIGDKNNFFGTFENPEIVKAWQ